MAFRPGLNPLNAVKIAPAGLGLGLSVVCKGGGVFIRLGSLKARESSGFVVLFFHTGAEWRIAVPHGKNNGNSPCGGAYLVLSAALEAGGKGGLGTKFEEGLPTIPMAA